MRNSPRSDSLFARRGLPLEAAGPSAVLPLTAEEVECRERLGGLLKHYRRQAV
jgi:hypothetical protein